MENKSNQNKPNKKSVWKKKTYTYAEAHNRAFWAFNKASKVMIWAGVFNVLGLMIAIVQSAHASSNEALAYWFGEGSFYANTLVSSTYQYSLCYSICGLFFRLLEIPTYGAFNGNPDLPIYAFMIITVLIAIIVSAITVWLSVSASQGKKWALYSQSIFYLIDSIMIGVNMALGENNNLIWISFALHLIILFFIVVSLYQYYNIFRIEKVYKSGNNQGQDNYDEISISSESNSDEDENEIKNEEKQAKASTISMMEPTKGANENGTNDKK